MVAKKGKLHYFHNKQMLILLELYKTAFRYLVLYCLRHMKLQPDAI